MHKNVAHFKRNVVVDVKDGIGYSYKTSWGLYSYKGKLAGQGMEALHYILRRWARNYVSVSFGNRIVNLKFLVALQHTLYKTDDDDSGGGMRYIFKLPRLEAWFSTDIEFSRGPA